MRLQNDVLYAVAQKADYSVRDMKGMFNQVVARSQMQSFRTVSMPEVVQTLERYSAPRDRNRYSLKGIIAAVAQESNVREKDLTGKKRAKRINEARQIAMYLCRELTDASLNQIGEVFGRSHTTVMHGCNKIAEEIDYDRGLQAKIDHIREGITKGR